MLSKTLDFLAIIPGGYLLGRFWYTNHLVSGEKQWFGGYLGSSDIFVVVKSLKMFLLVVCKKSVEIGWVCGANMRQTVWG